MSNVIEILQVTLITKGESNSTFVLSPNEVIFFTTKVFLNRKILEANSINLRALFFSRDVHEQALELLEEQGEDDSKYNKSKIIENNLKIFKLACLAPKEQIPVTSASASPYAYAYASNKMSIVSSKYIPDSFKENKNYKKNKNVIQYLVTFEVYVVDSRRTLADEDFKRASCKLKAAELNKQAQEIFGISLGLDTAIPVKRIRPNMNGPNGYGPTSYGTNPYGPTSYGPTSYGSRNSLYGTNPYGSTSYGPTSYGTNPYGPTSYGTNPYGPTSYGTNPYGPTSYAYGTTSRNNEYTPQGNAMNIEVLNTRKALRELIKDYDKQEKHDRREFMIQEWQNYKREKEQYGMPFTGMGEWINKREEEYFLQKYNIEWLKYKAQQERLGKKIDIEGWVKDKIEEERENKVEYYLKEWLEFKNNQSILGKMANLAEWLKMRVKRRMEGGKHMRSNPGRNPGRNPGCKRSMRSNPGCKRMRSNPGRKSRRTRSTRKHKA
jgi:hypothetical protein